MTRAEFSAAWKRVMFPGDPDGGYRRFQLRRKAEAVREVNRLRATVGADLPGPTEVHVHGPGSLDDVAELLTPALLPALLPYVETILARALERRRSSGA